MANGTRRVNLGSFSIDIPDTDNAALNALNRLIPSTVEQIQLAQLKAQERVKMKELEIREKKEAYDIYNKEADKLPYLSNKVAFAKINELDEVVDNFASSYNLEEEFKVEKKIQEMAVTKDWRTLTQNYLDIINNPESTYYRDNMDGLANSLLKGSNFFNIDFLNEANIKLTLLKKDKESLVQNIQELSQKIVAESAIQDEGTQKDKDRDILEQQTKVNNLKELESEINILQNDINNPLNLALKVYGVEIDKKTKDRQLKQYEGEEKTKLEFVMNELNDALGPEKIEEMREGNPEELNFLIETLKSQPSSVEEMTAMMSMTDEEMIDRIASLELGQDIPAIQDTISFDDIPDSVSTVEQAKEVLDMLRDPMKGETFLGRQEGAGEESRRVLFPGGVGEFASEVGYTGRRNQLESKYRSIVNVQKSNNPTYVDKQTKRYLAEFNEQLRKIKSKDYE